MDAPAGKPRLVSAPPPDTPPRTCARPGCATVADATLGFRYRDRAAVLGPLAATRRPHDYDLCERHAARTTPPEGWSMVDERPDAAARTSDEVAVLAAALGRASAGDRPPVTPAWHSDRRAAGDRTSDGPPRRPHRAARGRAEAW